LEKEKNRHDIAEILLEVALSTKKINQSWNKKYNPCFIISGSVWTDFFTFI